MIAIEGLKVSYGEVEVLKGLDLSLGPGLHLLLGRNGSGKTTLLKAMAGLLRPSRGRVLVMGRDVHRISRREAVKLVGYAWQNPYAGFVEATVADELEFTSRVVGVELKREIVDLLVPRHLLDRNPFTLSGGEAKRVSIASVLAVDQPVWLLDEPFDYMDCEGVRSLAKVINYGVEKGKAIVVASASTSYIHMLKVSHVVVLSDGVIAFEGSPSDLSDDVLERAGVPTRAMLCGP
jgi:energy-coupling factor transport system ATP-binding protein